MTDPDPAAVDADAELIEDLRVGAQPPEGDRGAQLIAGVRDAWRAGDKAERQAVRDRLRGRTNPQK